MSLPRHRSSKSNMVVVALVLSSLISLPGSKSIAAANKSIGYSPHIINGQTPDDEEKQCTDVELYKYVDAAKEVIRSKWQPVKGFANRHVTVIFTVRQNGTIEETKIIDSSGSQAADRSALEALNSASPLAPLPKGTPESIQIRYVFDWRVH